MPYQICKGCKEAFSPLRRTGTMGRPLQYCDRCSTPTERNKRSRARKEGKPYSPDTFDCLFCREVSDQTLYYPFCSEDCQKKVYPALMQRCGLTEKALQSLIQRGGLLIALQDATFTDDDLTNLCDQLNIRRATKAIS